jgi:hypothetical protein
MISLKDRKFSTRPPFIIAIGLLFTAAMVFNQPLYSFNWPVTEPIVTSTFGSSKWSSFGIGIEIYGNGMEVRPSDDGELLFYQQDHSSPRSLPGGMGAFAVVEHERKLRTLYGSLDLTDGVEDYTSVTASDILGRAGDSGKSSKPHVYFSAIDSEFEQFVNPLLLLNSIPDLKAPVIREIGIQTSSGYYPAGGKEFFEAGDAELFAEIFDPCMAEEFFCPMAPYKIQLFLNGEEKFFINFESMASENNSFVIQSKSKFSYSDFYKGNNRISLGTISLVPGEYFFELLVYDYAGNETIREFKISVLE